MTELTTTEAAALLTERGYAKRTHKHGALTADAVKRMCYRGLFPGARRVTGVPGRGYWLIPLADIDALTAPPQARSLYDLLYPSDSPPDS